RQIRCGARQVFPERSKPESGRKTAGRVGLEATPMRVVAHPLLRAASRLIATLGSALALLIACSVLSAADVEEHETIHKTFAGAKSIEIDNVNGSIQVIGSNGPDIQADIEKTLRADDADRAEAAKREVKLDVTEAGGDVKVY